MTHAQMAIFVLMTKHGIGYTPPAVGNSTGFSDVSTTAFAAAWIKEVGVEGISNGSHQPCYIGKYFPDKVVTRAEMASILLHIIQ